MVWYGMVTIPMSCKNHPWLPGNGFSIPYIPYHTIPPQKKMPENHKKTHADRKKHSIISITSHQPTLGHLRDTLVQHIFLLWPPNGNFNPSPIPFNPIPGHQCVVQSTKVLTFSYCIHGTGQEFAPSVFARSTLARPCFCRTGTSSGHQSQLKPIRDIQRSKGCQWVLFDRASVHAIEPLLEWQSIRKCCSWHLMCVCHFFCHSACCYLCKDAR